MNGEKAKFSKYPKTQCAILWLDYMRSENNEWFYINIAKRGATKHGTGK